MRSYTHRMTDLSRDYLIEGYISYTFGPQDAENYMANLFKVDARKVVATRDQNGAFYVFNQPPRSSPSTASELINGQKAWLLDYVMRSAGSVVPQQLWIPQRNSERIQYVDHAKFRLPVFFVNIDHGLDHGSLGVSVKNASTGQMQLLGGHFQQPFSESNEFSIRITWPGYDTTDRRVRVRDWTPKKNHTTLERVVRLVGRYVRQYLSDCERIPTQAFNWRVGHGNIAPDEVILIGLVQVSEGSWMPILQLMSRIVL